MISRSHLQTVPVGGAFQAASTVSDAHLVDPLPPFHSWGLVFGLVHHHGADPGSYVGRTNLPGDLSTWAANELPWGSVSESALALAGLVVQFLRPDWKASFWSREYLDEVARDFAHRFLAPSLRAGGHVSRQQINAWLGSLGLAVLPLPTSVRLAAGAR